MIKIIIDGNFCLHKSFSTFRSFFHKGIFTGTCYGILRDILLLAERFDTNDINVCWDSRSFRKDLSSDYKATRIKDPKNNPYDSYEEVYNLLAACGIKQYKEEGFEADDLIYTLSLSDTQNVIYTRDRDMFQCLSANTSVLRSLKEEPYTLQSFQEEYDFPFTAKDFVFYKSVVGDGSDNIKGIMRFPKAELVSFIKSQPISERAMDLLVDNHTLLSQNKEIFELKKVVLSESKVQIDMELLVQLRERLGINKLFTTKGSKTLGIS